MTFKVNATKSGLQNLYDLLNARSPGRGFTSANTSFGAVSVWNYGDPVGPYTSESPEYQGLGSANTLVDIIAFNDQGYSGTVQRVFTRLNPGAAHDKTGSLKVLIAPTDTQQQIKDKIISAVGCIGADVTVTGNGTAGSFKIPTNENDTSCTFTLTAKAGSYVYVDSYTAQLTVPDTDIPLEIAIPNLYLGGFTTT